MSTETIQTAAGLLKVHPKTVLDMISSCELPAAKVGRAYVILTSDVMAYIERAVVQQTAKRMRSTEKVRKVRPAQVGVAQHHAM